MIKPKFRVGDIVYFKQDPVITQYLTREQEKHLGKPLTINRVSYTTITNSLSAPDIEMYFYGLQEVFSGVYENEIEHAQDISVVVPKVVNLNGFMKGN